LLGTLQEHYKNNWNKAHVVLKILCVGLLRCLQRCVVLSFGVSGSSVAFSVAFGLPVARTKMTVLYVLGFKDEKKKPA
jgi:hypothetical protein